MKKEDILPLIYSRALLRLSQKTHKGEKYISDLKVILSCFEQKQNGGIKALKKLLCSPLIARQKKKSLLKTLFQGRIEDDLFFLLGKLSDENRLCLLPKIFKLFSIEMQKKEGILAVEVVVSNPLDETNKSRLEKKLAEKYQKKIEIRENIEPAILGGMILFFSNKMLDYSLKTRLSQLEKSLGS